jgi:hypothetical protein
MAAARAAVRVVLHFPRTILQHFAHQNGAQHPFAARQPGLL